MCLSVVPFMAPSASAIDTRTIIYGQPNNVPMIMSPSPLHDELLAPTYNMLAAKGGGVGSLPISFAVSSDGTIYSAIMHSGYNLMNLVRSTDGGETYELVYTFPHTIVSIFISEHDGTECVWVDIGDQKIYRSVDHGETFEPVLDTNGSTRSYWSFASDGDKILIGEYGDTSTPAAVYMSTDMGDTWSTVFDTSVLHSEWGSHIHMVKIDPYNGWIYVTNGDSLAIRSALHVSRDGGQTWTSYELGSIASRPINGFLAATFPDPDRVFFYADNYPEVWEWIKSTGEFRLILQMPQPYVTAGVKAYSAATGAHGVSYMAMTEYNNVGLGKVWMTIDGSSWYLIDDSVSDTMCLQVHDGMVYGSNLQFRDLTKEEASQLLADDRRTYDMMYGSAKYMYLDRPLKDVTLTVTGKSVVNLLDNPSFESWSGGQPVGWTVTTDEGNTSTITRSTIAKHGSSSVKVEYTGNQTTLSQSGLNRSFSSDVPLILKISIRTDSPVEDHINDPEIKIHWTEDGSTKERRIFLGGSATENNGGKNNNVGRWTSYTMYWPWYWQSGAAGTPVPGTDTVLTGIDIIVYGEGRTYYIDEVSLSEYPIFVEGEAASDVSFMLGDQLIDVGPLADNETRTISLDWLDKGIVSIVPVSGLAYTVSIDGTPATASDESIHRTSRLLEQTIPLIVGLMVISGLITLVGKAFGRIKF